MVDRPALKDGAQPGALVADRYELLSQVGEGGMGAVWRARHVQLESDVAIKLMSPSIAEQPEALNRFLREARAAARLTSLHVVKVFDYGVDEGTPYIVMELLRGENLRERIDRDGPLSPETTLRVLRHASRALEKAHAEGIVHRDLKPENLFVTRQEEEIVKVLDFGVAKLSTTSPGSPTSNTRTGAVLGTPFYMSPEQARGIKAVDHRSDVWSLGVIAFECLTGKLPFDSEAFGDLVLKICTLPAPVPSSVARVPAGVDEWFARVTEKDPDARFATVDEMFRSLEAVLAPGREPTGVESVARAGTVPASSGRGEGLSVTGTDVTASQTLMGAVPKRGLSPRAWAALIAGGALVAAAAVAALSLRPGGGEPVGASLPAPAAAATVDDARSVRAPVDGDADEWAAAARGAVAESVPAAAADVRKAAGESPSVTPAVAPLDGEPRGASTPAAAEAKTPTKSRASPEARASRSKPRAKPAGSSRSRPRRAVRPAARKAKPPRPKPPRPPAPARSLAPGDLFSDPD